MGEHNPDACEYSVGHKANTLHVDELLWLAINNEAQFSNGAMPCSRARKRNPFLLRQTSHCTVAVDLFSRCSGLPKH